MGEQQNLATFRRMWDAYATGRLWVMLDELAEDATWHPMGSERVYTGHEQILAWAEQVNRRFKSVTVVFGDMWADGERCVVATGRTIMYDVSGGQAIDTDARLGLRVRRGRPRVADDRARQPRGRARVR